MSAQPQPLEKPVRLEDTDTNVYSVEGYRLSARKAIPYFLALLCTGGFVLILCKKFPITYILLRLECVNLEEATIVALKARHRRRTVLVEVSVVDQSMPKEGQDGDLLRWITASGSSAQVRLLQYRYQTYYYDPKQQCFMRLPGVPHDLPQYVAQLCSEVEAEGLPLSMLSPYPWDRTGRQQIYGTNTISVPVTSVPGLLVSSLADPFVLFQIGSAVVWVVTKYYAYAAFVLGAMLVCMLVTALHTHRHLQHLAAAAHEVMEVEMLREGQFVLVPSSTLVPGDLIRVQPGVIPADMVLVRGECVVDESVLTGEAVRMRKVDCGMALDDDGCCTYDPAVHCHCTLMGGSKVVYGGGAQSDGGGQGVLVVVVRTGWHSFRGNMFRSLVLKHHPCESTLRDSLQFISLMVGVLLVFFIWSAVRLSQLGVSTASVVERFFDLMTCAIPPILPVVLCAMTAWAIMRLKSRGVTVTLPGSIRQAGLVDVVCLDKTGTLTESSVELKGVLAVVGGKLEEMEAHTCLSDNALSALVEVMACCHGLSQVGGAVAGDPLDHQLYAATGWKLREGNVSSLGGWGGRWVEPRIPPGNGRAPAARKLLRHYPYTSTTQRQMTVVQCMDQLYVLYKGSPEVVAALVGQEQLPSNYQEVVEERGQQGTRVVALAVGAPKGWGLMELKKMQPHVVEALTSFKLVGLVLLSNPLRPESATVVTQLVDAGMRCVMVTGDHLRTAIALAQQCGMIPEGKAIWVVDGGGTSVEHLGPDGNGNDMVFRVLKPDARCITSGKTRAITEMMSQVMMGDMECAVSGLALRKLLRSCKSELLQVILRRGTVFARMSPEDKRQLLLLMGKGLPHPPPSDSPYPHLDCRVAFCGDGANDLGALKVAHVGLSLSKGLVTAAMSSPGGALSSLLAVLKEGRNSREGGYQVLKFMAGYAVVQAFSVSLLYTQSLDLTNAMVLVQDLAFAFPLALLMGSPPPAMSLSKRKVGPNVLALREVVPTVLQVLAAVAFQAGALGLTCSLHECDHREELGLTSKPAPQSTLVGLLVLIQMVVMAVLFHGGPPHRQPVYKNYPILILATAQVAFVVWSLFSVNSFTRDRLGLMGHSTGLHKPSRGMYLVLLVGYVGAAMMLKALVVFILP